MTHNHKLVSRSTAWNLVCLLAVAVFAVGLIRTAWIAEDAFITFRTIDNFFNGFGLRWNVAERVQTYSHPLWMMALCVGRAITGEHYYSTLAIAAVCTVLVTYALAFRLSVSAQAGACCLLVLAFSKTFVEYSTSGLEGPLTHLLLVAFAMLHYREMPERRKLLLMTLVASFGAVNRADTVLLYFPALLLACRGIPISACIRPIVLGGLPLAIWVLFATLYYGTPIPVTGYAKAMTGIDPGALVGQGVKFYKDVATRDPILLPALCSGLIVAFLNRSVKGFGLALGALLYCAYLLKIGGGYMTGRFLTPPFLVAVILLARVPLGARGRFVYPLAIALTLVLGFLCSTTPILSGSKFSTRNSGGGYSGIVDERGMWYQRTGLLAKHRDIPKPNMLPTMLKRELDPAQPQIFLDSLVGLDGFLAGPGIHFVDSLLCDPFLMRLPAAVSKKGEWKVGHFGRKVPDGYLESVAFGKNRLSDPNLIRAYDDLLLLTRAKIFSLRRLRAMWSLQFGEGQRGLRKYAQAPAAMGARVRAQRSDFPGPCAEGTFPWNERFRLVPTGGLLVSLEEVSHGDELHVGLCGLAEYEITFLKAGKPVGKLVHYAGERSRVFPGIFPVRLDIPDEASKAGFNVLKFRLLRKRRSGIHCVAFVELD